MLTIKVFFFTVWAIDFIGVFPSSFGNKYINVVVEYVSKWVEVIAFPTNEARYVLWFFKNNILTRFGSPKRIICNGDSHFCNRIMEKVQLKYGVNDKVGVSPIIR